MKSLAIIAILSAWILSGCAYPTYQRGYVGYGSGYSTGYGVQTYSSFPATMYYRQSTVPIYPRAYSSPYHGHGHDHGAHRYEWNRARDRHDDMRRMERHLDREQAIHRSGDLNRRHAQRLDNPRERFQQRSRDFENRHFPPMESGGHRHGDGRGGHDGPRDRHRDR